MFQLDLMYKPQDLTWLSVSNKNVLVGLKSGNVQRLDLEMASDIESLQIIKSKSVADTIQRVFVSHSGVHTLITVGTGDVYYLHKSWTKPGKVKMLRNMDITAVGWNNRENENDTGDFLVGTSSGQILCVRLSPVKEGKVDDSAVPVYSLNAAVTGLRLEYMDGVSPGGGPKYFVLATNPTRIFQFIGGPDFPGLFERYATNPQFAEVPGDVECSKLALYNPNGLNGRPKAFAWLTAHGVYYGDFSFGNQGFGETITGHPQLMMYQGVLSEGKYPIGLAVTEFHIFLVYDNCYQAICRIDETLVVETPFPPSIGRVWGVTTDPSTGAMWLFASAAVYEVYITDEARDVWKLYLDKQEYDLALQYTMDPIKRDKILTQQAEEAFGKQEYEEAAAAYARTKGSPFEEIALKFINIGAVEALKEFLVRKLDVLPEADATQRTLICTWLTEIFLTKLNELEDEPGAVISAQTLKAEFEGFLEMNKDALNVNTTFHLISSHGRVEEMLFYANLIGDRERIITHHIHAGNFVEALDIIVRHARLNTHQDSARELFYKFSPVLMYHIPAQTVEAWVRVGDILAPAELIPALTRYDRKLHSDGPHQAVRYLNYVIYSLGVIDPDIHNFMVSLLATSGSEEELLAFLSAPDPRYDLKYALRLCTKMGKRRACVAIYTAMEMYDEAVDLALTVDLDLAIETTQSMEVLFGGDGDAGMGGGMDDESKPSHKLWLKIAKHVLSPAQELAEFDARLEASGRDLGSLSKEQQVAHAGLEAEAKEGVDKAISFLADNKVLRIEDVLPFFPDFTVIDEFKSKICEALNSYDAAISELEQDMEAATESAEMIRQDVRDLKHRFGYVSARQKCDHCGYPILTRDFYLFPCQHVFHFDCLFGSITPNLSRPMQRRVDDLMDEILRAKDRMSALAVGVGGGGAAGEEMAGAESAYQAAREALDRIVAKECLYCGGLMIDSIDKPFVDVWDEREKVEWAV